VDKVAAGGLAGLGAGIVAGAVSHILFALGICRLCMIAIGGGLFRQQMLTEGMGLSWNIIGWVNHLLISSLLGVLMIYLLVLTGRKYILLKGLLYGAAVWFVAIELISPLAGYIPPAPNPVDMAIMLGYHMLYGVVAAWLLARYFAPALTRT
jgi:hypothetical protein